MDRSNLDRRLLSFVYVEPLGNRTAMSRKNEQSISRSGHKWRGDSCEAMRSPRRSVGRYRWTDTMHQSTYLARYSSPPAPSLSTGNICCSAAGRLLTLSNVHHLPESCYTSRLNENNLPVREQNSSSDTGT